MPPSFRSLRLFGATNVPAVIPTVASECGRAVIVGGDGAQGRKAGGEKAYRLIVLGARGRKAGGGEAGVESTPALFQFYAVRSAAAPPMRRAFKIRRVRLFGHTYGWRG